MLTGHSSNSARLYSMNKVRPRITFQTAGKDKATEIQVAGRRRTLIIEGDRELTNLAGASYMITRVLSFFRAFTFH